MTVITKPANTGNTGNGRQRQETPYDGRWINVGIYVGDDEDATFVRMPRGIAVADLVPTKVYAPRADGTGGTSPEYAQQMMIMNDLIAMIQEECLKLKEGESKPMKMEVQLYRKIEEAPPVAEPEVRNNLRAAVFGTNDDES